MSAAPSLDAHIVVERERWRLDAELAVPAGTVLALLGPNGAGKSTALRVIAGLLPASAGHVRVGERIWEESATGVRLATELRSIGVVFQDYLLFPTMNARDNVAFGLRAKGMEKAAAREIANGWLARVGLLEQAGLRPLQLSGGQAQRVALARALATTPDVLLLDEPLAALDAGARMSVRGDLRRHLGEFGGATVLVTHDPLDALILADHVAVIEAGAVVQTGTPQEITRNPRTRYVAQLVGLNLFEGRADADGGQARRRRRVDHSGGTRWRRLRCRATVEHCGTPRASRMAARATCGAGQSPRLSSTATWSGCS